MSVIINIDHEEGNLSEYTATVEDSGDLSVTEAAALAGTGWGLSCLIDDSNSIYGDYHLGSESTTGVFRCRFYFDPNNLTMGASDNFALLFAYNSGLSDSFVRIYLFKPSGFQIYAYIVNDGGGTSSQGADITDEPHYIEVKITRATSSISGDGRLDWWIDGAQKTSITDIDNYDRFVDFDLIRFGGVTGIDATTSGTFYLDELIVNDDGSEIGPVSQTKSVSDTGTGIDILSQLTASLSFIDNGVGSDDVIVTEVLTSGSVCWGHVTGVIETNIRTFVDNWTGTGAISGSGDGEQMCLDSGQYMESEIVKTGVISTTLIQNNYAAGDTVALKYRHGVDSAACLAASWNDYTIPFESLGYVQVRVEYAL